MKETAKLKLHGQTIDLPVIEGSENEVGINIETLRNLTGAITVDPGYSCTGSCESKITFIDGEKGILRYRGYDINDLCKNSNFLEVSYLLIHGELPNQIEFDKFLEIIRKHTMINEEYKKYYDVWPQSAHPMALLSAAVCGMSTFYSHNNPLLEKDRYICANRLLAKLPTLAAYAYKKFIGQPFIYPKNKLNYCENFLNMMFSVPAEDYELDPLKVKALNQLFILHADHEQNCSTSTVRMVGSSHANLYASIAAGILALWGPLHGGANQAVLEMLNKINQSRQTVEDYINEIKKPGTTERLMGFGHRVYKNFDPRCSIIKETSEQLLRKMKSKDPLLDIAKRLEEVALSDPYFIERKLYPNVDFYSGIIYKALNIPVNMFTVLFAIGRLPGWIAHWMEMMQIPQNKICRPRQIYQGNTLRKFVPLNKR